MMRHRDRLRNWRLNRGMSQKELAAEWGVAHSFVSQVERGARPMPAWMATRVRQGKEPSNRLTEFGETMVRILRLFRPYVPVRRHCPDRAATIARMRAEGAGVRDIAAAIGTSRQTVYNYLHNRRGYGRVP